jgi:hypothetical protein
MVVKMTMLFWVVTPCRLVRRYQRFRETKTYICIFRAEDGDGMLTLVRTYQSTRLQNPGQHRHDHNCFMWCKLEHETTASDDRAIMMWPK